jgi:hypothetical protein
MLGSVRVIHDGSDDAVNDPARVQRDHDAVTGFEVPLLRGGHHDFNQYVRPPE